MQPPLKKQRTDSFDPYYGDLLSNQDLECALRGLFPDQLCADLAKIILATFEIADFVRSSEVCKSWNLVANHHLAPQRAEIYKSVFSPEDWNLASPDLILHEEMKLAFRSIPLNIDIQSYHLIWSFQGMTLNAFAKLWKKEFSNTGLNNPILMNDEIAKLYGDSIFEKSCWTAISIKNITYQNSNDDLENFNKKHKKIHIIPKLLDVVLLIFAGYKKFGRSPNTYTITACQEMIKGEKIFVRGSVKYGIKINSCIEVKEQLRLYPQLKLP